MRGLGAEGAVQRCTIPDWHPPQELNNKVHWWTRRTIRQETKALVTLKVREANWQPVTGKAKLEIVLIYPQRYRNDRDNLTARAKAVCDALVTEGLIRDDSEEWLELVVRCEVERGRKATVLRLEAA